jgi:adenosyl cobinamide kinase/adenosyl cobinamide phosphate guanylyltransferase
VPSITLVLGGTRSGKSEVAERMAAAAGDVTYVATAVADPDDAGFAARIAAHRRRRPASWRTVESGPDLAATLRTVTGPALVDSLGTWVAATPGFEVDVAGLCSALVERGGDTVVVSEEVGLGVHPATELGVEFGDALGDANRAVAAVAGTVLLVVAGRVLTLHPFERP